MHLWLRHLCCERCNLCDESSDVIAGINLIGAFLVGIATSPHFPRRYAPFFVSWFRIVSAIVSVDAYLLLTNSKQVLSHERMNSPTLPDPLRTADACGGIRHERSSGQPPHESSRPVGHGAPRGRRPQGPPGPRFRRAQPEGLSRARRAARVSPPPAPQAVTAMRNCLGAAGVLLCAECPLCLHCIDNPESSPSRNHAWAPC